MNRLVPQRRPFNMIEITIALLIVGTGLISILGIFPIAATTSRDAVGLNYSSDAGEQMLNFISARCQEDWTVVNNLQNSLADISTIGTAQLATSNWTRRIATGSSAPNDNSGIWTYGSATDTTSIYRVIVDTSSVNGYAPAFDGIARIWKSPTTGYYYNGTTMVASAEDTLYTRSAQLNIEISWPAQLPYSSRQKAYYALEVSKQ